MSLMSLESSGYAEKDSIFAEDFSVFQTWALVMGHVVLTLFHTGEKNKYLTWDKLPAP